MTILQPVPASQATRLSQDFYRINQPAESNGDIFKLDIGIRAIIVGPESDFSEYSLYYFDVTKQSSINIATVTVDQPWIAPIAARLDATYPNSNQKGFLYIVPKDFYIPGSFLLASGSNTIFAPNIDIIAYTKDPAQIPDKRPRRCIESALVLPGGDVSKVFLPVYGRKSFTFRALYAFQAVGQLATFDVEVCGIRFGLPVGNTFSNSLNSLSMLGPLTGVSPFALGNGVGLTYDAEKDSDFGDNAATATGAKGRLDYLEIRISVDNDVDPETELQGGVQIILDAYD